MRHRGGQVKLSALFAGCVPIGFDFRPGLWYGSCCKTPTISKQEESSMKQRKLASLLLAGAMTAATGGRADTAPSTLPVASARS